MKEKENDRTMKESPIVTTSLLFFFFGLLKPSKIVPEFLAKVLKFSNEIENMSQIVAGAHVQA